MIEAEDPLRAACAQRRQQLVSWEQKAVADAAAFSLFRKPTPCGLLTEATACFPCSDFIHLLFH
ncbi:MAG: hypothetical protein IJL08_04015 [Oscillospiraceae bacterium]|nr:hypothetical protein [Oscillospiraceae bacterium]